MKHYLVVKREYDSCIILKEEEVVYAIPIDPANTDYQAYLAWVEEGNIAEEWTPEG